MKYNLTRKILQTIFDLSRDFFDEVIFFPARTLHFKYESIMRKIEWQKNRSQFAKAINNLKHQGYLKTKIKRDEKAVVLTPKGFEKVLKLSIEQSEKKKRRDGKWQMIIWDIPENYKKTRERFRASLKLLGYQQLQKSVWVCPYDVLKKTEKLVRFYRIEKYIRMFLIKEIES